MSVAGRDVAVADDHDAGDDAVGVILGTAAYMSPEQARASRRQTRRHLGLRL